MFSQYIDGTFFPLEQRSNTPIHRKSTSGAAKPHQVQGKIMRDLSQIFGDISKHFSISQLDTGDILLVLIILFLFLEGDNLELVITLGLMLLLGFHDD